jgi:hypothetical protein
MTWSIYDYYVVRQQIVEDDRKEMLLKREKDIFKKLVGDKDAFSDLQRILDICKKIESIKGNRP